MFEELFYSHIGGKIKTTAKIICLVGMVTFFIIGIRLILLALDNESALALLWAFLVLILGPLACWIGSLVTYGLGELIETTKRNEKNTYILLQRIAANTAPAITHEKKEESKPKKENVPPSEKPQNSGLEYYKKLFEAGFITEEKYNEMIGKH
jgi:hypothetical protein